MLGSLRECNKDGIPQAFKYLTSTSYIMPSNLALTDSDLEGIDYGAKKDMNAYIEMTITTNKTICNDIKLNSCYTNVNPMEEEANYTEIAGVSWDYNGPLQTNKDGTAIESNFYKPGGHFLGLSCKNSETNVKTCVNLTRICEHGVWMSQRQTLNIPSNTIPESYPEAFPVK